MKMQTNENVPVPCGQVETQIGMLRSTLQECFALQEELAKRLDSVLRRDDPKPEPTCTPDLPLVPLADAIRDSVKKTSRLADNTRILIAALEL